MSHHFEDAIARVLRHEGLFVDDTADPGGATKYGISLRAVRRLLADDELTAEVLAMLDADNDGDIDAQDVRRWDRLTAETFYHRFYWLTVYDQLTSARLAAKVFDTAVNMGHARAHELLQLALRRCDYKVKADGILGAVTLLAANLAPLDRLLRELSAAQAARYARLAAVNKKLLKFIDGWMRRAVEV